MRQLDPGNRLFASIDAFLTGVDVVENELLDPATMPDPFGTVLRDYYATLERYRLLTYGRQIVGAVRELERPGLADRIHATLRYLIVDEYQEINPAQERLTRVAGREFRRQHRAARAGARTHSPPAAATPTGSRAAPETTRDTGHVVRPPSESATPPGWVSPGARRLR